MKLSREGVLTLQRNLASNADLPAVMLKKAEDAEAEAASALRAAAAGSPDAKYLRARCAQLNAYARQVRAAVYEVTGKI